MYFEPSERKSLCLSTSFHFKASSYRICFFPLTVGINVHDGPADEQQLHDLQRPGLGAVVQRRVALDGLPVDVRADADEVLGDPEVALVAGYHEAGVAVSVGYLDICKGKCSFGHEMHQPC